MSSSPLIEAFTPAEREGLTKFKADYVDRALTEASGDTVNAPTVEIWGVPIVKDDPRVDVIIVKFLRANKLVLPETYNQFVKTLKWRKEFNPLEAAMEKHDSVYDTVGYVIGKDKKGRLVTYNLYGGLDNEAVFGNLDQFLRWRVGLMERAIAQGCDFITTDSIAQVHDYKDTSMFSMSAVTRRASKSTIQIFADYYPELLAAKFFVNVPRVLAWVFGAISNFLSKETVAKFVVLSDARDLSQYIDLDELPERYGGQAKLVSRPATGNPQEGNNAVSEVTAKVEGIDLNKVDGNPTVV